MNPYAIPLLIAILIAGYILFVYIPAMNRKIRQMIKAYVVAYVHDLPEEEIFWEKLNKLGINMSHPEIVRKLNRIKMHRIMANAMPLDIVLKYQRVIDQTLEELQDTIVKGGYRD